jgi:hypothetical protein
VSPALENNITAKWYAYQEVRWRSLEKLYTAGKTCEVITEKIK